MPSSKDECLQEASHTITYLTTDELLCRLHKDHKKYYHDLLNFERMLELVKIEYRRVLRDCTTTIEIRDAQIQRLCAEIEALKA